MNLNHYISLIITLIGATVAWLLRYVSPTDAKNWFLSPWISPIQFIVIILTLYLAIYFFRKKRPSPLVKINKIGASGIEVPPFQGVKFFFTILPATENHLHSITENDFVIDKIECPNCWSHSVASCKNYNCEHWFSGYATLPPCCLLEERAKANFLIELKHIINKNI